MKEENEGRKIKLVVGGTSLVTDKQWNLCKTNIFLKNLTEMTIVANKLSLWNQSETFFL
jgi:hypothetical protein